MLSNLKNILIKIALKKKKVHCCSSSVIRDVSFEGYNSVGDRTSVISSSVGKYTYIGHDCHFSKCSIGRFCSFGANIKMAIGEHPTRLWVSTHPAFFSTQKQCGISFVSKNIFCEKKYVNDKHYLNIGNDVWIGDNVTLLCGLKIGDGAIIAAGSVVTKDVLPYSIVGGNPARIIRYRFSEEDIKFLIDLSWWNKNTDWINTHSEFFSNIDKLKEQCNEDFNNSNE